MTVFTDLAVIGAEDAGVGGLGVGHVVALQSIDLPDWLTGLLTDWLDWLDLAVLTVLTALS